MASWTNPHEVLDIPRGSSDTEVKLAYRRALLAYHPDKVQSSHAKYTIDDINEAYRQIRSAGESEINSSMHPDVINFNEVLDLADCEETELSDGSFLWTRKCRCGEDTGYMLFEKDLELNGDADEIAVQCSGCSIWVLVQYAVE